MEKSLTSIKIEIPSNNDSKDASSKNIKVIKDEVEHLQVPVSEESAIPLMTLAEKLVKIKPPRQRGKRDPSIPSAYEIKRNKVIAETVENCMKKQSIKQCDKCEFLEKCIEELRKEIKDINIKHKTEKDKAQELGIGISSTKKDKAEVLEMAKGPKMKLIQLSNKNWGWVKLD